MECTPHVTPDRSLIDMLWEQVRSDPGAAAIVDDTEGQITFQQLWDRAGSIAETLSRGGVRPGDRVGVASDSSAHLITFVWGILLAGAGYLPLAVDYPDQRLRYMIADSTTRHVVADKASSDRLEHLLPRDTQLHRFDDLAGVERPAPQPKRPRFAGQLAYVIYTSGSTGQPKGVMVSHGGLAHQISWLASTQGVGPGERILFKTPASFDAAQWEILANAAGATIVASPIGSHRDPERIVDLVNRHRVSLLQCVPTLWHALVGLPGLGAARSLRHVFSGGDVLSTKLAAAILDALPNARLVNLYGPTETTINVTWQQVGTDQLEAGPTVGIGSPVPGCCIHVLDAQLEPVATGEVGELCIGGPQVALGYCNRPELTSQRFVAATIGGRRHRVYRTGDLAMVADDATITFCGRLDDQVKVNGHRVETEEVRLAIEEHDWVNAAAVVPWTDPGDHITRLAAFVELDASEAALMDEDRAGEHHRSKANHAQVKAQLAGLATRSFPPGRTQQIALPRPEGRLEQRRVAFARKTYRFFDGPPLTQSKLVRLAELLPTAWPTKGHGLASREHIADLLRWLGPFHSEDRLLPKYAYASPGALNATQTYLEIAGIADSPDGFFYYHPHAHQLFRLGPAGRDVRPGEARLHLVGLPRAIKSVYSTNVREVLHLEAGHITGLLDLAAAEHGAHLIPIDPAGALRRAWRRSTYTRPATPSPLERRLRPRTFPACTFRSTARSRVCGKEPTRSSTEPSSMSVTGSSSGAT